MSEIAIIGAGAWGTALAIALGRKHRVRLWAHETEVRDSINQRRSNDLFLPGHKLPESVTATGHYQEAVRGAAIVVSVMPSHHCRRVFEEIWVYLTPEMLVVSAT